MRAIQRLLPAAILLASGLTPLAAQQASTYEACYVPSVGAIYLINQDGLPTECLATDHVAFTWTSGDLADGAVTEAKLAFDPATQAELNALLAALSGAGTINDTANPIDWTQLKNVPADFADGVDDGGGGATDHGALMGLGDDDHPQYLLAGVRDAVDGFAVTGTIGSGAIPATGAGTRLMWYPGKGAFRAGGTDTEWDDGSIGGYSTALGSFTTASGSASSALGERTTASGSASVAAGYIAQAIGDYASAIGYFATARGNASTAMGSNVSAGGDYATAMGDGSSAGGTASMAVGINAAAQGYGSVAMGWGVTARGGYAAAMGIGTTAQPYGSVAIGRHNAANGSPSSWVDTDPLLVAGNGTSPSSPSNALTLYKNGDLEVAGTFTAMDGLLATGALGSGSIPAEGTGTRLMWYPAKAAFRAGRAVGGHWDDANIGSHSTAFGQSTIASALASTAMGNSTTASGGTSTAMGAFTTASGTWSTAMGQGTEAIGHNATAMGFSTVASAYSSLAIGRYNAVGGSQSQWVATDPLFVAGNGSSAASPSNALTLLKNGNLTIAGTLTQNSDIRLKEDIEPVASALDGLLGLTPIRYRFRGGTGHPTERQIGLSAQEVRGLFPELVSEDAEGHLSVAYANLTALLIRALQEQETKIDALRAEVDALRADTASGRRP